MRSRANNRRRRGSFWRNILRPRNLLIAFLMTLILGIGIYNLPPVHERVTWWVAEFRADILHALNPPDEIEFLPGEGGLEELIIQATQAALNAAGAGTPVPTMGITSTPEVTLIPTVTPTPLPERVFLEEVTYVDQHNRWNYCGPANLTMGLKYWGWSGNRDDVARAIKPGKNDPDVSFIQRGRTDVNVMPYEMAGFVQEETEFNVVLRSGGDLKLVKRMIANGYPVLIEKGYVERDSAGKVAWLGHYQFVTGYDEAASTFTVQDAYIEPGENLAVSYEEFIDGWRGFNYLFMVVYPPDREAEVFSLLGDWGDPAWANQHALEIALEESGSLSGVNQFFAWFNLGSSHVSLLQYTEAGLAYDFAFVLYAGIEEENTGRPYRIMFYQTGPYWAYFYTGRYQDVIDLANITLYESARQPTLEESIYWRGMAKEALGDINGAIADYRETVYLNASFTPGWAQLNRLGVSP